MRRVMAWVSATPGAEGQRGDSRREGATGSAAKAPGYPPKGALAMRAVGVVVATRVVLQDGQCILLVQPLSVQAGNEQTLDLRQGQRWSFFLKRRLSRSRNSIASATYSMCRCHPVQLRFS